MAFLKNITSAFKTAGGAVQNVVGVVTEKNRKTALANRLRTVIRCEEKAIERSYIALGRYYYNNLRDAVNADTEPHCMDIQAAEQRIEAAVQKLEELCYAEEEDIAAEITLEDVTEIPVPSTDEFVPEGIVDEAVEPVAEVPVEAATEEKDASEDLPYA